MEEFTSGLDHKVTLDYISEISSLTKQDIVDFANKYFKDNNYVAVYKRKGADNNIVKVENLLLLQLKLIAMLNPLPGKG